MSSAAPRPEFERSKRLAGDVSHAGIEGNLQGQFVFPCVEFLEIGEADNDNVIGLHIAERQREEIPSLHFDQCRAMALCSLPPCDSAGILLLHDLRANSAVVDDHLAPVDSGLRGKREMSRSHQAAGLADWWKTCSISTSTAAPDHLKSALDCLERKIDSRLFKPGYEAEGGGGCVVVYS